MIFSQDLVKQTATRSQSGISQSGENRRTLAQSADATLGVWLILQFAKGLKGPCTLAGRGLEHVRTPKLLASRRQLSVSIQGHIATTSRGPGNHE